MSVKDRNNNVESLTDQLRKETAQDHAAMEKLMQARRLSEPKVEREFLIRHHRILCRTHRSVIDQLQRFQHDVFVSKHLAEEQEVLNALTDDLAHLEPRTEADPKHPFLLSSAAQAYGALYVVLGSNMGRSFLSRQLSEAVKEHYLREPRYYSTSANPKSYWLSFKNELDELGGAPVIREEALKGAFATFALFNSVAKGS